MSSCPRVLLVPVSLLTVCVCALSSVSWGQGSHSEQVQIAPPLLRTIDPPAPEATAADLEARADQLRASKLYLDALDYYRAAMAKQPGSATLLNKVGITELMMHATAKPRSRLINPLRQTASLRTPTTIGRWCFTKRGNTARR